MSIAVITGSGGLVGSEAALYFARQGFHVVGIDNDLRREFFGDTASTAANVERITSLVPGYEHFDVDIRDEVEIGRIFWRYGRDISLVIHTAAQPSHDWAARAPFTDFSVNATGTLVMLEATRQHAPDAVFIFTSTNKVYGDRPNSLPLVELETRWEIQPDHQFAQGISEEMPIDQTLHSVFGASKVAADVLVQEYGRYFGLRTAVFRGGCLTGPFHSGAELHGFLSYLVRCTLTGTPYTIFGYKGKQVRDNIHSADLVRAFHEFFRAPRIGEVYNIGGGRFSNCSILEAIELAQNATGRELNVTYRDENRIGDHIWWISNLSRFREHYPAWHMEYDTASIISEIAEAGRERWLPKAVSTMSEKRSVLGIGVSVVDYGRVVEDVVAAAQERRPLAISALAVHGVMTGVDDAEHRARLNSLDVVVPDGQPVRWALNLLHGAGLHERVYGPTLMLEVCRAAERAGLGVYLYGSTDVVLDRLVASLHDRFPGLRIVGATPSRFRPLTTDEKAAVVEQIPASGAQMVFVGLGCPRQEVWAYEYRSLLGIPILAVGAAFEFHAGTQAQAPSWMQARGLEWLFRLRQEPRRLWRRYVLLNPRYLVLIAAQYLGLRPFPLADGPREVRELSYG